MRPTTDLVKDSKLRTAYREGITRHTIVTSDQRNGHRRIKREQRWQRVGDILGEGAFGIVWKEELVGGESEVKDRAVKRIRKRIGNSSSVDYSRELETIAKFSRGKYKSYFVESYGWFESQDHVFITMEFFEHGDLQEYMNTTGKMLEEDARSISYQILEGVYQMHDNGFAHRDLKPSNVLIRRTKDHEEGWWVKIGDFGISKRAEEGMTALRTVAGTAGFLAPEVLVKKGSLFLEKAALSEMLMNEREYTFAIDIWALGEITYRAICGFSPFLTNLAAYANAKAEFPTSALEKLTISAEGIELVQGLMKAFPRYRLTASEALEHVWFDEFRDGSSQSSGDFQSVDETYETPSDMISPTPGTGTSGTFVFDASESAPWTDLDKTATFRPSGSVSNANSTSLLNKQAEHETEKKPIGSVDETHSRASILGENLLVSNALSNVHELKDNLGIQPDLKTSRATPQPQSGSLLSEKRKPNQAYVDDEHTLSKTQTTEDSRGSVTEHSEPEMHHRDLHKGSDLNSEEETSHDSRWDLEENPKDLGRERPRTGSSIPTFRRSETMAPVPRPTLRRAETRPISPLPRSRRSKGMPSSDEQVHGPTRESAARPKEGPRDRAGPTMTGYERHGIDANDSDSSPALPKYKVREARPQQSGSQERPAQDMPHPPTTKLYHYSPPDKYDTYESYPVRTKTSRSMRLPDKDRVSDSNDSGDERARYEAEYKRRSEDARRRAEEREIASESRRRANERKIQDDAVEYIQRSKNHAPNITQERAPRTSRSKKSTNAEVKSSTKQQKQPSLTSRFLQTAGFRSPSDTKPKRRSKEKTNATLSSRSNGRTRRNSHPDGSQDDSERGGGGGFGGGMGGGIDPEILWQMFGGRGGGQGGGGDFSFQGGGGGGGGGGGDRVPAPYSMTSDDLRRENTRDELRTKSGRRSPSPLKYTGPEDIRWSNPYRENRDREYLGRRSPSPLASSRSEDVHWTPPREYEKSRKIGPDDVRWASASGRKTDRESTRRRSPSPLAFSPSHLTYSREIGPEDVRWAPAPGRKKDGENSKPTLSRTATYVY